MPKDGGSIDTVPNYWSNPIYMSAILGGGKGQQYPLEHQPMFNQDLPLPIVAL